MVGTFGYGNANRIESGDFVCRYDTGMETKPVCMIRQSMGVDYIKEYFISCRIFEDAYRKRSTKK